jgi:hypothetical protein
MRFTSLHSSLRSPNNFFGSERKEFLSVYISEMLLQSSTTIVEGCRKSPLSLEFKDILCWLIPLVIPVAYRFERAYHTNAAAAAMLAVAAIETLLPSISLRLQRSAPARFIIITASVLAGG